MGKGIVRILAQIDVYVEGKDTDTAPASQYSICMFGDVEY